MADTNEMLQQAIAAARAGKTAEAKVLVDHIIADDPDNPHALFLRGMLAENQDEQREYMDQVLSIDPEHRAAKKRMAQLEEQTKVEVPAEPVAEVEPIEEEVLVEPEIKTPIDETVVAATVVADEVIEDGFEETVIVDIPELPVEDEPEAEELIFPFEEEDELTFEEIEEAPFEGIAETAVATSAVDELPEVETPVEDDIPEWLFEEARSEEELLEIDETQLWADETEAGKEELPDWLQEDTAIKYEDVGSEDELVFPPGDFEEELFAAEPDESPVVEIDEEDITFAAAAAAPLVVDEVTADESLPDIEPAAVKEPAKKESPKKKKSGRGLEILLVVLIIVAVIVVGALAFLIINPPA